MFAGLTDHGEASTSLVRLQPTSLKGTSPIRHSAEHGCSELLIQLQMRGVVSVLIEALALVVPKRVLDVSYPGGIPAFVDALQSADHPPRFVCDGDARLVVASYFDPDHLVHAAESLVAHGIVWVDDGKCVEIACVDQECGPTMPCDWLVVERHRHGFTHAWKTHFDPGDLEVPQGWRLEQSWRLERSDVRAGSEDWLRLDEVDGIETWIDFSTAQMTQGLSQNPPIVSVDSTPAAKPPVPVLGRTLDAVRSVLELREIPYRIDLEHRRIVIPFATDDVDRVQVMATREADGERLRCEAVLPDRVPSVELGHVRAVAARLDAISWRCAMWLDDGTRTVHVTTWTSLHEVEDPLATVESGLGRSADHAGRVGGALRRLAAGRITVEDCVALAATAGLSDRSA